MSQLTKVGSHKTSIYVDDEGYTNIIYHQTAVVKFNQNEIILNTDGWDTTTTKTRMNQASNQFNLGFRVYQKDFNWYIDYRDINDITFFDRIILSRV